MHILISPGGGDSEFWISNKLPGEDDAPVRGTYFE